MRPLETRRRPRGSETQPSSPPAALPAEPEPLTATPAEPAPPRARPPTDLGGLASIASLDRDEIRRAMEAYTPDGGPRQERGAWEPEPEEARPPPVDPLAQLVDGDMVEGTVTRLAEFGAFVRLPGGAEGLLHKSNLAEKVDHPNVLLKEGDSVHVRILRVDHERGRVTLSMRQAADAPPPRDESGQETGFGVFAGLLKDVRIEPKVKPRVTRR
jgi:predicted RNA-binding protein with RPS1 domain